jgi:hypothetical protein
MKLHSSLSLLFLLVVLSSCRKDEIKPKDKLYMHISHPRTNSNPKMDSIVEHIDYNKFDLLLLGGDLAYLTSEDDETMTHVDSVFDLASSSTLWSLGNHDYSDLNRVEAYTGRPPYYSYYQDGITYIVLDTQDSLSNIIGDQLDFYNSVVDTIQESTHLVVLHHKLIWMYGDSNLEPQIPAVSNTILDNCFYCINPNNFYQDVYPKLVEVKDRGIEVVCIGGDIGYNSKQFEHVTEDEIHFLASGISDGSDDNRALIFKHDVENGQLTWSFSLISQL